MPCLDTAMQIPIFSKAALKALSKPIILKLTGKSEQWKIMISISNHMVLREAGLACNWWLVCYESLRFSK